MTPQNRAEDELLLARLAGEQQRVVSRTQLAELGYDRHYIRHRVRTDRWQPIGDRVVAMVTGTLTKEQRLWVAFLHSGPRSALAAHTAAEAAGLAGFTSPWLRTVVPHGTEVEDLVHPAVPVRVQQSRRFGPGLVQPAQPPRIVLPHAVIDAASERATDNGARLIIISAVQQGLLRPGDLRDVLAGRMRVRRRAIISESINDVEGGAHSLPEAEWNVAIRRYGLPEPVRQQRIQRANGTWYLDAELEPWQVGVEINGSQHGSAEAIRYDGHRRNVLGIGGRLIVTIESYIVRRHPGQAVIATAAALLARGWQPSPSVLSRLERLAAKEHMDVRTGDWLSTANRPRAS